MLRIWLVMAIALTIFSASADADDVTQVRTTDPGGEITVKDFTKLPSTVVSRSNSNEMYLAGADAKNPGSYQLVFNPTDRTFRIVLRAEPLARVRELAQRDLADKLGIGKSQMCKLVYAVFVAPNVANNEYRAKNLKFSYCRGAVNLAAVAQGDVQNVSTESASLGCSNTPTALLRLICADPEFAKLDGEMRTALQYQLSQLPQAEQRKLLVEHDTWAKKRNGQCKLGLAAATTIEEAMASESCVIKAMRERLAALSPATPPVTSPTTESAPGAGAAPAASIPPAATGTGVATAISAAPAAVTGADLATASTQPAGAYADPAAAVKTATASASVGPTTGAITPTAGTSKSSPPAPASSSSPVVRENSPFTDVRANVNCQAEGAVAGFPGPMILVVVDPTSVDPSLLENERKVTLFLDHMKVWSNSYCISENRAGKNSGPISSAHMVVVGVKAQSGWNTRFEAWDLDTVVAKVGPHFSHD
jgi:uncharacterized protein YecT (DUF1311 family)